MRHIAAYHIDYPTAAVSIFNERDLVPASLQVLALVFVRKVLDLCFSKRELSYLDDLMPEWKKKNLDDASKKIDEVVREKLWDMQGEKKLSLLWEEISNISCSLSRSRR